MTNRTNGGNRVSSKEQYIVTVAYGAQSGSYLVGAIATDRMVFLGVGDEVRHKYE